MNIEQQELLLRMKLLMGYDTKKTLSENYNRLLNEQDPPTLDVGTFPERGAVGKGRELPVPKSSDNLYYYVVFLNANSDEIGPGKKYNYLWLEFLNKVKGANLQALLDTRNSALSYDKIKNTNLSAYDLGISGGITPDLPNWNQAGFTGPATAVLDTQIYALRLDEYLKLKNQYQNAPEKTELGQNIKYDPKTNKILPQPKEPEPPRWDLLRNTSLNVGGGTSLNSVNVAEVLNSLDSFGKSANQIVYDTQSKTKEKEDRKKCPVPEGQNDLFRGFVNSAYPGLAKLYELNPPKDPKGTPYCSNSVRGVWNHPNTNVVKSLEKFTGQKYSNTYPNIPDVFKKFLNTLELYSSFTNLKNFKGYMSMDPRERDKIDKMRKNATNTIKSYGLNSDVNRSDIGTKYYKDYKRNQAYISAEEDRLKILKSIDVRDTYSDLDFEKIISKMNKSILPGNSWTDETKKEVSRALDCIFLNETDGNDFRLYVNTVYPNLAKKSVLDLSETGDFCNDYINKAYNYVVKPPEVGAGSTLGQLYNKYKSFRDSGEYKENKWDLNSLPSKSQTDNLRVANFSDEDITNMFKANEIAQALDKYDNEEYYQNNKFNVIFGKEKLLKAKKECPYELEKFLEAIKLGIIYDKNTGLAYGEYAMGPNKRPYMVKWTEDIPCTSEFWETYGKAIQAAGMIASFALTIPSLGTSLTFGAAMATRLFIAAAIDVGVNLTSAHFNYKAGKTAEGNADVAIAFISAALDLIPGLSKAVTFGMDEWSEELVKKTFINKVKDGTISSYDDFLKYLSTLSTTEQKVLRNVLDHPEMSKALKNIPTMANSPVTRIVKAMDGRIAKVTNQSSFGLFAETILKNVGIKVPVTLSPMLAVYGPELFAVLTGTYEMIYGETPNLETLEKFKENYRKYFPTESHEEIADSLIKKPSILQEIIQDPNYLAHYVEKQYNDATVIVDGKTKDLSDELVRLRQQRDMIRNEANKRKNEKQTGEKVDDENTKMVEEFKQEIEKEEEEGRPKL